MSSHLGQEALDIIAYAQQNPEVPYMEMVKGFDSQYSYLKSLLTEQIEAPHKTGQFDERGNFIGMTEEVSND